MNSNPLVSIVTVCFNSKNTIARAIQSVIDQTYLPIEYIVIDGFSTDGTVEILNKFKNNIDIIISEKDNGISDAFNKGIKLAKGEFIQLLNADDVLDKDKIKNSVELLLSNPTKALVYGDIIKSEKRGKNKISGIENYNSKINYVMPKVNHPTFLVRSDIYKKYGMFDLKYKVSMDYDWFLRIHRLGEESIYSPTIKVFVEGGGASDAKATTGFNECREISIKHGLNPIKANIYFIMRHLKQIIYKIIGIR